jgi:hypothetical protein
MADDICTATVRGKLPYISDRFVLTVDMCDLLTEAITAICSSPWPDCICVRSSHHDCIMNSDICFETACQNMVSYVVR